MNSTGLNFYIAFLHYLLDENLLNMMASLQITN